MIDKIILAINALGGQLARVRHVYSYITGDPTRAGCVRLLTGGALVLYGIAAGTQASSEEWLLMWMSLIFGFVCPFTYRKNKLYAQAFDDGSEVLPRSMRSALANAQRQLVVVVIAASLLPFGHLNFWLPGYFMEVLAFWVAIDDGKSVRRSLATDLRKLLDTPVLRLRPATS